eukprot:scaffold7168_cov69-Phaeocystis_antarctica.AAC.1
MPNGCTLLGRAAVTEGVIVLGCALGLLLRPCLFPYPDSLLSSVWWQTQRPSAWRQAQLLATVLPPL